MREQASALGNVHVMTYALGDAADHSRLKVLAVRETRQWVHVDVVSAHGLKSADGMWGKNDCYTRLLWGDGTPVDGTRIEDGDPRLDDEEKVLVDFAEGADVGKWLDNHVKELFRRG